MSWHFSVQKGSRNGGSDGESVILRANGGDMYYTLPSMLISLDNVQIASCVSDGS